MTERFLRYVARIYHLSRLLLISPLRAGATQFPASRLIDSFILSTNKKKSHKMPFFVISDKMGTVESSKWSIRDHFNSRSLPHSDHVNKDSRRGRIEFPSVDQENIYFENRQKSKCKNNKCSFRRHSSGKAEFRKRYLHSETSDESKLQ